MRYLLGILLGLSSLSTAALAAGDVYTGNDIANECRATKPGGFDGSPSRLSAWAYDAGSCMGFMKAARALVSGPAICVPKDVTNGQFQDVVVDYITQHPATRHLSAAVLTALAAREAFPCPAMQQP